MTEPYTPEFASEVKQIIKQLDLSEYILVPNKTIHRTHMPRIYQRSNIVITPSYYEGLGFTAVEALAAARPLVATDVPGLDEVCINNSNCLTVPPQDSQELANAINKLLNDETLANRLAQAAPASIQKFNMRNFVDFLETAYKNYLE
jgi:glycosyltransferase involved in cell wall biosynthesis